MPAPPSPFESFESRAVAPDAMPDEGTATARRLDFWNARLLDLSRRNHLLYFNPAIGPQTRSPHGVLCVEPDCDTLWNRLARRGQSAHFAALTSEFDSVPLSRDESDEWVLPKPRPLPSDKIRAEPSGTRLAGILENLRSRSRVSLEEAGIVSLFLAFGFLRWSDDANSESYAPLLLVPVELTRASPREPLALKRWGDEVQLNPALRHTLETDFGIVLPAPPALETKTLASYWEAVQSALATSRVAVAGGWCVLDWVVLGTFASHKMAMLYDLQANRAALLAHPLVCALGGERDAALNPPLALPRAGELDAVAEAEVELVLDADSSQHEAILAARRGLSFVLQGPPGTGKSQTIANLIAECLEAGKTVLFVSEKMAALDVVHRRLQEVGLGDFCLEAHSHQANKRAVIAELHRVLQLAPVPFPSDATESEELDALRASLNAYVAALHRTHPVAGLSLHTALGHLASLDAAPSLAFDFPGANERAGAQRAAIETWLEALARLDTVWRTSEQHLWHGVKLADADLQTREQLRADLGRAAGELRAFEAASGGLSGAWGVPPASSLDELRRLLALTALVAQGEALQPATVARWLGDAAFDARRALTSERAARWREWTTRRVAVEKRWQSRVFDLDIARLRAELESGDDWLARAGGVEAVIAWRGTWETLGEVVALLESIERAGTGFAVAVGLDAPTTWSETAHLTRVAGLLRAPRQPLASWFAPGALSELESTFQTAHRDFERRRELEADLSARWHLDRLLALPCAELATRFQTRYHGFFARWSGAFRADRALVAGAQHNSDDFDVAQIGADLEKAVELQTRRRDAEAVHSVNSERFGSDWNSDDTDWAALHRALHAARDLSALGNGALPAPLIDVVCGPRAARELALERGVRLETAFAQTQNALAGFFALFTARVLPFTDLPLPHAPLAPLRDWLVTGAARMERFFAALDEIDACYRNGAPSFEARRQALDEVAWSRDQAAALAYVDDELRAAFGPFMTGEVRQWETIVAAMRWGERMREWFDSIPPPAFLAVLGDDARRLVALELAASWRARLEVLETCLERVAGRFETLAVAGVVPERVKFGRLTAHLETLVARFDELDGWLRLQTLEMRARELGLSRSAPATGFWEALHAVQARGETPPRDQLAPAFWKRFWTLWADAQTGASPELRGFDGDAHDIAVGRFARLDRHSQILASEQLRAQLSARRAGSDLATEANRALGGQIGLLQREALKKTRHLAVRALFEHAAELIQSLKPCVLMSPLSVAQFLPLGRVRFDLVVFDEASQIAPEDALGALVRASQVIVVGDSQQMPPSRFFAATESQTSDEAESDAPAPDDFESSSDKLESILDECLLAGLPQQKLLWHYRSRREELIAFSNRHFYGGELMTFPGPFVSSGTSTAARALSWEKVEGFYTPSSRGAGEAAQTNRIEARHVARLAVEHARRTPNQSLGIITFNEAQKRAIETEIDALVRHEPGLDAFFWKPRPDGFFVKALENVQGDERDVIFFSVGFGPRRDADGRVRPMRMNFGPLAQRGGERRLNVAITRARARVHIVTSFEPDAIDLARAQSEGARLLRAFLEWAQHPGAATSSSTFSTRRTDALADALTRALQSAGWKTHRDVGLGDLRVDVGIEAPDASGELLLGVLCDGDDYRRCATARDRDRLRPQMLERLGWRLHRVWSPDWARNSARETQKVLEALEDALRERRTKT